MRGGGSHLFTQCLISLQLCQHSSVTLTNKKKKSVTLVLFFCFRHVFFSFFSGGAPCWDPPPLGPHSGHYSHVAYCPVFSLLSGGKCDKVAFSFHHRRVFRGRGAPHAAPLAGRGDGGRGVLWWLMGWWGGSEKGGQEGHFVAHGDCFTQGYRKVRSKINEETAARVALGSVFC